MSRVALISFVFVLPSLAADPPTKPVPAVVESSLKTADGHIRQFAFDGDAETYFASESKPGKDDHFTLRFDAPITVKSVTVTTGRPKGDDRLDAGALMVSGDGKTFVELAKFQEGKAGGVPTGKIQALRVLPGATTHPLVIREFQIESDPPLATFRYPIEFTLDVSDSPEIKEWAEKAVRICERQYPMINDELKSDGYKSATQVSMTLKKDYKGVAATGGNRIVGSSKFFQDHPDDFGAMVHETVHVVQHYRTRNNPGWLVEGVADYIRFFKYEPGKIGRINAERARYDGSYRVTAAFFNYVTEKYDKELVRKLNKAMREGEYKDDLWKELTKKTAKELDEEWRGTLKK